MGWRRQIPILTVLVREEDKPQELIKTSKEGKMGVAKIGNDVVGILSLTGNRLRRFFVHPDYQRMGIGRSLVENAVSHAKNAV